MFVVTQASGISLSVRRAMFVATHAGTIHLPSRNRIGSNVCYTEGINVLD